MSDAREPGEVRRLVVDAAAAHGIRLPAGHDDWDVCPVPLAPFPARLRLDVAQRIVWHDVVAAEVVPPVVVERVVEDIALPRPEVRLMVGEAQWMAALSYPLPFDRATAPEVGGLLAAGALYAAALALALEGHASRRWRATLQEAAFRPGHGFPFDPRTLLQGTVADWPDIGQ